MRSNKCPKCQGSMSTGFILDEAQGLNRMARWVEGPPVNRWYGLKLSGKRKLPIEVLRCARCGFLESYANE